MGKVDIVPATTELVQDFYGYIPPKTIRAIVAVKDGETIAVGGVFNIGMGWMVFSDMKPEFQKDKRNIAKGAWAIRKLIENIQLPVYAKAADVEGAETLIDHIGVELWDG